MPRKTDTRERLLEAAIAVIESEGEAALKVADVAAVVNVAAPSVYHFFGDREGLVVAALSEMYRRSLVVGNADMMGATAAATTREEFAGALLAVLDTFNSEEGARRRALRTGVLGAAVRRPALQRALVEMNRVHAGAVARVLQAGADRGVVRLRFDATVVAMWATAVIAGRHYGEIDDQTDLEQWNAMTREAFRHLLLDDIPRS